MHQFGPPINLHIDGPLYVGTGFCAHLPDKSDTAVLSKVVLENSAGKVHYSIFTSGAYRATAPDVAFPQEKPHSAELDCAE
jgi:hypothetical protein